MIAGLFIPIVVHYYGNFQVNPSSMNLLRLIATGCILITNVANVSILDSHFKSLKYVYTLCHVFITVFAVFMWWLSY